MTDPYADGLVTRNADLVKRLEDTEAINKSLAEQVKAQADQMLAFSQQLALVTSVPPPAGNPPPNTGAIIPQISAHALRPTQVSRFDGTREGSKTWVDLLDQRLMASNNWDTLAGLDYAVNLMDRGAQQWYLFYKHEHPGIRSWPEIRGAFLLEYQLVDEQNVLDLEDMMLALQQTGSFDDYCTDFRALARRLTQQTDEFKQRRFMKGSCAYLRDRFADKSFPSLAELISAAQLIQTKVPAGKFDPDTQAMPVLAAIAAGRNGQKSKPKAKPGAKPVCFYCDKPGHVKSECRAMKKDMARAKEGGQKQPVKKTVTFGKYDGSGRVHAIEAEAESDAEGEGQEYEYTDEELRDGTGNGLA